MRIVYLLLLSILLISYWRMFSKVIKNSSGLTPLLGWLSGLAYFLLAPLTIITLGGGYELPPAFEVGQEWHAVNLTNTSFLIPYLVVWTCMMGVCFVIHIFYAAERQEKRADHMVSRDRLQRVIVITMALTLANWAILVWFVGGIEEFLISHWQLRMDDLTTRLGDAFVLTDHLFWANQVIFTAASALYTGLGLKNGHTRWRFTSMIILFFLLEVVLTGNRIYFAIYLISFFISCLLSQRKKVLITMFAISPILVLVFSAWSSLRHNLMEIPDSVTGYTEADFGDRTTSSLINVTEGMDVLLLLHIVNDFGNRYEYLYGITYSRAATSLIPRRFYPQKPDNFTLILAQKYLPGVETSLNATAVGEMYANFGGLTLILFPLFTSGVVILSQAVVRTEKNHGLLPAVLFVALLWAARSTIEDNFISVLLAMFMISILRLEKGLRSPNGAVLGANPIVPNLARPLPALAK